MKSNTYTWNPPADTPVHTIAVNDQGEVTILFRDPATLLTSMEIMDDPSTQAPVPILMYPLVVKGRLRLQIQRPKP